MYKSKTGLADNQLKVIKGSGSNNDDDSSSSLAATAGLLAIGKDAILNIAKEIKQAFQKFVEDNKNNMISVSEYPFDSLPVSDRYPYYLCYQKTDGTYYCYAYKADSTSGDLSTIPSLYDSTSCTLNVYLNTGSFPDSYYYYLSSGYLVCNLYKWDSANETWVYDSFTRRPIFNYAYVGYGRWDILYSSVNLYNNIRNETFEQKLFESSANVDVAVQDVNDYLDNLGLKTRVTENLLNDVEPDNIFENVTTSLPYGGTYNGIVLDPSSFPDILPAISAAQSAAANGTGTDTDTNSDVTAAAAAAAENTPLSTPDIDPDTEETLSGEPTSSFGNINLYKTDGLLDKFPFCIPADIFRCVAVLSADPVAPYWEFPFKFERWGIDETIVLDMSKFDSVAAISRWVETLCFIYILANKTKQYMFV
jgi:hypothetical protein